MCSTALEKAIQVAGSAKALAKTLNLSPMAISHWRVRGIPSRHVIAIEAATGVSRQELRPDLYPSGKSAA